MENKSIPDESLTSSSKLDSNHEAFHGRIEGNKAWCSAIEDKNPYIEITLDEEKTITEIVTQGSASDLIWSTKYRIEYLEGGKWTSYKEVKTLSTQISGKLLILYRPEKKIGGMEGKQLCPSGIGTKCRDFSRN